MFYCPQFFFPHLSITWNFCLTSSSSPDGISSAFSPTSPQCASTSQIHFFPFVSKIEVSFLFSRLLFYLKLTYFLQDHAPSSIFSSLEFSVQGLQTSECLLCATCQATKKRNIVKESSQEGETETETWLYCGVIWTREMWNSKKRMWERKTDWGRQSEKCRGSQRR